MGRKKGSIAPNRKPDGIAAMGDLYIRYKAAATKRGLTFELTKDEFHHMTQQRCQYCRVKPKQVHQKKYRTAYIYNGIDRVDNAVGYTISNTVTCCGICNRAKGQMSHTEFIQWIERLRGRYDS